MYIQMDFSSFLSTLFYISLNPMYVNVQIKWRSSARGLGLFYRVFAQSLLYLCIVPFHSDLELLQIPFPLLLLLSKHAEYLRKFKRNHI